MEQTGHGIPLIIRNYGKQAFDIMENFINVTIPFNYERTNNLLISTDNSIDINEAEKHIMDFIKDNPHITIKELVALSRYSDGYVRKILSTLKEKKLIERKGGRKEGVWELRK